ncbi:MAG: DUF167 domain-containing protein [Phreatobacter sp.]|nr:DUF167 domain-containing protein [Phreatobacter sp.]
MSDRPYRIADGRLMVDVRLTPRGGRDALDGIDRLADGRGVLKARVRAVPEDGKANAALEALVASSLGVARSAVSVVQGKTARVKTLAVSGDPALLASAAAKLVGTAAVALMLLAGSGPATAQFLPRGDICADPTQFLRTRATVERAGLATPERARLVRTIRAAQQLATEACPKRDGWLIRRAVGMLNAVNREVRLPPVDVPLFLRD